MMNNTTLDCGLLSAIHLPIATGETKFVVVKTFK